MVWVVICQQNDDNVGFTVGKDLLSCCAEYTAVFVGTARGIPGLGDFVGAI